MVQSSFQNRPSRHHLYRSKWKDHSPRMTSLAKSWLRVGPAQEDVETSSQGHQPSLAEVLIMLATMFAIHLLAVCRVSGFWELATQHSDDMDYVEIAGIIRNWHFAGGPLPGDFWGFPYAIAAGSKLFSIPELMAAVLISVLASLAVCILAYRLYGGWVTAAFVLINYEWTRLSVEGGSEPLFMCLLYASFVAVRADRWNLAALLASLSTVVRPVGVFALVSFAVVLAMRRDYRQLATITLIGLGIGTL